MRAFGIEKKTPENMKDNFESEITVHYSDQIGLFNHRGFQRLCSRLTALWSVINFVLLLLLLLLKVVKTKKLTFDGLASNTRLNSAIFSDYVDVSSVFLQKTKQNLHAITSHPTSFPETIVVINILSSLAIFCQLFNFVIDANALLVGGVAQWLGRQSFAGGLSPIYA